MKAIVTIFKGEFEGKEPLLERLGRMAHEIQEVSEAYIFSPKPGVLMEFLLILKANKIAYGTHFDTLEQTPTEQRDRKKAE
ncbi:MAG TPA: hypothetical protein VGD65_22210 [Chryseosolibacter sp.]